VDVLDVVPPPARTALGLDSADSLALGRWLEALVKHLERSPGVSLIEMLGRGEDGSSGEPGYSARTMRVDRVTQS
jgi:hypothetical protein